MGLIGLLGLLGLIGLFFASHLARTSPHCRVPYRALGLRVLGLGHIGLLGFRVQGLGFRVLA